MCIILKGNGSKRTFIPRIQRWFWRHFSHQFYGFLFIWFLSSIKSFTKTLIDFLSDWFFITMNWLKFFVFKHIWTLNWLFIFNSFNFKLICKSKSLSFELWIHFFFFNLSFRFIHSILLFSCCLLYCLSLMRVFLQPIDTKIFFSFWLRSMFWSWLFKIWRNILWRRILYKAFWFIFSFASRLLSFLIPLFNVLDLFSFF